MPSQRHELHLFLFRNQPSLAADLIRDALGVKPPSFADARVASADLTEVQPPEYRADMVIELWMDAPVYGIVVEVVTADEKVARWAARRVEIGGLNQFTPYVLGPSGVPEVTDEAQAQENPELAVLSAMAHGRDANRSTI